jgi:hypothetical protein
MSRKFARTWWDAAIELTVAALYERRDDGADGVILERRTIHVHALTCNSPAERLAGIKAR